MKLVIGNKNYSTWSLRPWLLMSSARLEFEEIHESLTQEGIRKRLVCYSPTCKVPVLIDDKVTIWDSLAICEYISERYLDNRGWPEDIFKRAEARALCAEMHSGFIAMRSELPMNCRAKRKVDISLEARNDIQRIDSIFTELTKKHSTSGPWLFGIFSITDCFFIPVVLRLKTYGVSLSTNAEMYCSAVLKHPSVQEWIESSKLESEVVPENEVGT